MVKIQHWKVFHVHFGLEESKISHQVMKGISTQLIDEGMGVPISEECLTIANCPNISQYVNWYISIRHCALSYTISSNRISKNPTGQLYCFTQSNLYIIWMDMLHVQN